MSSGAVHSEVERAALGDTVELGNYTTSKHVALAIQITTTSKHVALASSVMTGLQRSELWPRASECEAGILGMTG